MTTMDPAKTEHVASSVAKPKNGRKTKVPTRSRRDTSAADPLGGDQWPPDDHATCVPANLLPPAEPDAPGDQLQQPVVHAEPNELAAADSSLAASHRRVATHSLDADGKKLSGDHSCAVAQDGYVAAELLFCAEFLDDVEKVRIATQNRMRAMGEAGIDGESYAKQVEAFLALEHEATLALQRVVRKHPLGPWIKRTVGVGEKQGARLLAAIGDPAYNHAADRPRRGPAELWAYCGFVPGQKRQKGVKSNWNATAKMRAFLIAESCIKCRTSPYRAVYDAARANWSERDVKDGHKHNHALRVTAKAILRDLFLEARKSERMPYSAEAAA